MEKNFHSGEKLSQWRKASSVGENFHRGEKHSQGRKTFTVEKTVDNELKSDYNERKHKCQNANSEITQSKSGIHINNGKGEKYKRRQRDRSC